MPTILLGNAPCSWGTLEFEETNSRPIPYTQMLDELAGTGYTGSELGDWGFMPTDPTALAAEFRNRKLDLTGAFAGVKLRDPAAHAPGEAMVLRTARLLANVAAALDTPHAPFLVLADDNCTDPTRTQNAGRITPAMGLSPEEWDTFAAGVNQIAASVHKQTGLRTVFHHHCGGFVETAAEIHELLKRTDPELVGLVFDTGHYSYGAGGCSGILPALDTFSDRIWYIHFKDCTPEVLEEAHRQNWDYFTAMRNGIFCELGQGCVDFPAVLDWLRRHEYHGYVTVEQDVLPGLGSPHESAARNRAYLHSIGL
jgi:inosose dehydratase